MSHPFKITLHKEDSDAQTVIAGEFSDLDWERLNDFVVYARELFDTKFVRNGMKSSLRIEGTPASKVKVSTELPDWEEVMAFLHRFRPILLQSESTNFYKICSLLSKEVANPDFRGMLDLQRDFFSGKHVREQFKLQSDDVLINSEQVLHNWLNGYEYHRDKEKREFIQSLHGMLPLDASKVIFIGLLTAKVQAVNNVAGLVNVLIGKQPKIDALSRRGA